MRRRGWLVETCRAVLFGVVLIALGYGWLLWQRGQTGYNRIKVGMSYTETDAIMEEYGYHSAGGRVNSHQDVLLFERHKAESPIVLIFGPDGRLKAKEQDSTVEYFLQSIHDALR